MNSLDTLYDQLDFWNGSLYSAIDDPSACANSIDWLEKGEWFAAAKRAGAEKIFFVDNNPVAVFAHCGEELLDKIKIFNRMWCLAQPRLLFLASPGEITVYDLAQKPINENKSEDWKNLKHIDILYTLGHVTEKLQDYHRDKVESGRLFEDKKFGDLKNRADHALIRDLKSVREELIEAGLSCDKVRFAHAIIGRSIFIRYLEDRGILTKDYFLKVAQQRMGWANLLDNPMNRSGLDSSKPNPYYPRVLNDKDFTYALFRELARDFNGDMFPDVQSEEKAVTQDHLNSLQNLLYGDIGIQKKLFFYSYRFDIVPLDLISSIYEVFYHIPSDGKNKENKHQDGVVYTPTVLVEFIISRVLTSDVLEKHPRVFDPGCGSGIFLVEAFRRMVRYESHKNKHSLTFERLKNILKNQIAGIEVNEEAARIAAFSLYLAMLHYLNPPDIHQQIQIGNKLPNLLATKSGSASHFHCILVGNTFDTESIEANPLWAERFGTGCADVIVGNPPWGPPGKNASSEIKTQHRKMLDWCKANHKPIGDKEPSQAFLWRVLDFLKKNGKAGMLVSAGVLFKHHNTSQTFRKKWMEGIKLEEIFNFSHVRAFFFKDAISPFIAILFAKETQGDAPVYYWSPKQNKVVKDNQSILLSKNDLRILRNVDTADYRTWKIFTWGSFADRDFLNYLANHPHTTLLENETLLSCVGFKKGNQKKKAMWLSKFKKIKINTFSRYEKLNADAFEEVPSYVERHGKGEEIYIGQRIVLLEAPHQADGANGRIEARLETAPYAYNHSFHVLKLSGVADWRYSVLIGILWSSFAKYYLFLTTYFWGLWHDKILINERLQLPIIFDESNPATPKIIAIVDKLHTYQPQKRDLYFLDGVPEEEIVAQRKKWEAELDNAVFELYSLNDEHKDLIRDLCEVTLPFYYHPLNSTGVLPAIKNKELSWIKKYILTFCSRWNPYLGDQEEMHAEIHLGAHQNMVAVEFFPCDKGDPWNLEPRDNTWGDILDQIGKALPHPMGTSQIILDGFVQVVSDTAIIIIKSNERRFWTPSLAREEAGATLCMRMIETMPRSVDSING